MPSHVIHSPRYLFTIFRYQFNIYIIHEEPIGWTQVSHNDSSWFIFKVFVLFLIHFLEKSIKRATEMHVPVTFPTIIWITKEPSLVLLNIQGLYFSIFICFFVCLCGWLVFVLLLSFTSWILYIFSRLCMYPCNYSFGYPYHKKHLRR